MKSKKYNRMNKKIMLKKMQNLRMMRIYSPRRNYLKEPNRKYTRSSQKLKYQISSQEILQKERKYCLANRRRRNIELSCQHERRILLMKWIRKTHLKVILMQKLDHKLLKIKVN